MALTIIRGLENAPLAPLNGKTVAVIGFGNQGHAHALNLRESGVTVIVGNRPNSPLFAQSASRGWNQAKALGFEPLTIEDATQQADLVIIALPDEVQPEVFEKSIAPQLKAGANVGFLTGFSVRYGLIKPAAEFGVIMVAPKGPGQTLRERFEMGLGIPCLMAVHQAAKGSDSAATLAIGLAWAAGIGCARAGVILTTFKDETETDLFGEQTVLCGGMTELILAAFETLVQAGYPPELAYLECCHEVKQIADLVYERGLAGMMQAISNTAEFGAYRAGPKLVDEGVRDRMRQLLEQIQDGSFARIMRDDYATGFARFNQHREKLRQHPIEPTGAIIRALMPTPEKSD